MATGRGPSAGHAIRESIDSAYWSSMWIGYYNGAVIRRLDDQTDPLAEEIAEDNGLVRKLREAPAFSKARIRGNEFQITIGIDEETRTEYAISVAARVLECAYGGRCIVASSHSIDLLLAGQSKLDVVEAVAKRFQCHPDEILRIGDKGKWPGNDAELLDHQLGLTVDEASLDPSHCWGLAPAGIKGLQATLHYLDRLKWSGNNGRLVLSGAGTRSGS